MGADRSRAWALVAAALLALLLFACDSKPDRQGPTNPFDRENTDDPFGLEAALSSSGDVLLSWSPPDLPGLASHNIYRMTSLDSAFYLVGTAEPDVEEWTDSSPHYFTLSRYRIAAVGAGGAESDTTGREVATIVVPPVVRLAGEETSTASRTVQLEIGATQIDSLRVSGDSTFAGVP